MPDHEPRDIADKDTERSEKPEARAARTEGVNAAGVDTKPNSESANMASDAAQAASEPMELQRLPDAAPPPPGRQRTGDPPASMTP